MHTFLFVPPLPKVSGGVAVILHIANILHRAGYGVTLLGRELHTSPTWVQAAATLAPGVSIAPVEAAHPTSEDLWLVPEGWPMALMPGLQAHARCIVYIQNWAFFLGNMPDDAGGQNGDRAWNKLPVSFISVSQPVAWYVQQATGKTSEILRPGIDTALFYPDAQRDVAAPLCGRALRIAWMPRKNKALAKHIRCFVEARGRLQKVEWLEIHNMTPLQVAQTLRNADIFLVVGFPEGCPLPPLEALASGCVVTGFNGFGGTDYMRSPTPHNILSGALRPWWPLRDDVDLPANGLYVADADVPAAGLALEYAAELIVSGGDELAALRRGGATTIQHYTLEAQRAAVLDLWGKAAQGNALRATSGC